MSSGLAGAASRGGAIMFAAEGAQLVLRLLGIVILARLLTPEDYGLVAMVTAIIGFATVVQDFGLTSAAVQAKTLSENEKDNLFWANAGIGLALFLLVAACSAPIAHLYGDDRLVPVTVASSLVYLINGFSTQFRANLMRNLNFLRLVAAEVLGSMVGLVVGIALAVLGYGYWALVWQGIAAALVALVTVVTLSSWFPGGIKKGASIRRFLTYGSGIAASQILGYASRNVDAIVLGIRFSPTAVGFYNRAFLIMEMPVNGVVTPASRVALPVLSQLQEFPARFKSFAAFGHTSILVVVSLLLSYLWAQAEAFVGLVLGEQWLESVPILRVLIIGGFLIAAGYVTHWIFPALGLIRANLQLALVTRTIQIFLVVLGSIWGVIGVAWGFVCGVALTWLAGLWWLSRHADFPSFTLFFTGLRVGLVFTLAAVASHSATAPLPLTAYPARLVLGLLTLLTVVAVNVAVWPRFRTDVAGVIGLRRHLRRGVHD